MIHPSEILRANSDQQTEFSAPVNRNRKSLDCGLTAAPWLTEKLNLQRFATVKVFLTVFGLLGILQGAMLSYFRGTSHIWTDHYYLGDRAMDWLIHLNDILAGAFAFIVTHWGNKIHRPAWFGGMVMLQAAASITLVVPEAYEGHVESVGNRTDITNLCLMTTSMTQTELRESNWVALAVLVIFQLFFAFASIVFYTLGITYLDDNSEKENSPIYLIIPLAAKIAGKQLGLYLSWIPTLFNSPNIFITAMWLMLSCIIMIFGFIIVLFPHSLPSTLIGKEVETLLNLAYSSSGQANQREEDDDEEEETPKQNRFLASFLRLIKNPILVINILAMVFMLTALINFEIYQNIFYQLRFFVNVGKDLSGYNDPFLAQIIMNIIKYPFIAVSLLATGLIVAKTQPSARFLASFNVAIYVAAALLYVSFVFSRCNDRIHSEFNDRLTIPFCSSHCICKGIPFTPVCTTQENVTYFSPCHAGCNTVDTIRGVEIYGNCTCGADTLQQQSGLTAVGGSCQKDTCDLYWAFAQVASVMASSILAASTVTNLMINIRCVAPEDKALALGFETTILGIFPFIPGKLIYSTVAETMCIVRDENRCLFHSESFGLFFSITTVVLMIVSAILAVVVVFLIGNMSLYGENAIKDDYDITMEDMEEIRRSDNINSNPNTNTRQNTNTSQDVPQETRNNDSDDDFLDSDFNQELENRNNQQRQMTNTNADVHNESRRRKANSEVLESDF
ncbi:hypothetical protein AMK59_6879 [Oryctes borbonicus]|uniref:Kazal-like domain-containing protein n=1 Tax=Oryctes borbonicus TaxID=1629725 RepID=A0A0T6AXK3_9SCAR|nr:hypothetical protein AMK59_6879 [Oryctes borbonicus]